MPGFSNYVFPEKMGSAMAVVDVKMPWTGLRLGLQFLWQSRYQS